MRKLGISLALTALAMAGCSADVGREGALLYAVDEGAMTSQVLYMVPDVSVVPLTAVQLEQEGIARAEATPVRVEIFDDIAVAWFAPAGEAVINRNSIIAMWEVVERTPIAGELSQDEQIAVAVPVDTVDVAHFVGGQGNEAPTTRLIDGVEVPQAVTSPIEQTIIDFFDRVGTREELRFLGRIEGYHPGCI